MESSFVQAALPNGLRIVIEVMEHVQSAACGFLARTGARDETPDVAGVSHFLEHMMFKGTETRTWERINVEFDEMGSHYNAFTSKDRTFYYGWVRPEDLDRQLGLLADMMRSALPAGEFDTEKNVILEEIAMSNDDLGSNAYDFLHEQACAGSPMAWPILGYAKSVEALTRDQMHAYFTRRYAPNNLVLFVAGKVDPAHVIAEAERLCGAWEAQPDLGTHRNPPAVRSGVAKRRTDRFKQQAVVLAFPSAAATDPLDETTEAVAAILGGPNSRFYWNIVQEGLSPRAGVIREEYPDFSLMVMYGLCEPQNAEKLLEAMRAEAAAISAGGVEPKEVQRVKNLRRTALATESEAPYYRLSQLVDDLEYHGGPRPAEERLADVDAVSADTIAACLKRFPITGEGCLVSVGPRDWPDGKKVSG